MRWRAGRITRSSTSVSFRRVRGCRLPQIAETEMPVHGLAMTVWRAIPCLNISLAAVKTSSATEIDRFPTASIVEIEGKNGVFVPSGSSGRTFAFHPVNLGREAGERQVVLAGLTQGDTVVAAGAFVLKSELILQNETEED